MLQQVQNKLSSLTYICANPSNCKRCSESYISLIRNLASVLSENKIRLYCLYRHDSYHVGLMSYVCKCHPAGQVIPSQSHFEYLSNFLFDNPYHSLHLVCRPWKYKHIHHQRTPSTKPHRTTFRSADPYHLISYPFIVPDDI